MKRLLYIAPLKIDFNNPCGIDKKIFNHIKVFQEHFKTDLVYYSNNGVYIYDGLKIICLKSKTNCNRYDVLLSVKNDISVEYECVYIRYPKSEFIFLSLLKYLKSKNSRIIIEIPTFPYDLEGLESIKGKVINLLDKVTRMSLKKYIDRIVTYSNDNEIFSVQTIKTINGIDFDSESIAIKNNKYNGIHLIAVSSMYKIHGYDRLIEGLNKYYASGGESKIIFDIVGSGYASEYYKDLTIKYNLGENVILHGKKFNEQLNEIYNQADIAVNSLAIHRQDLKEESTLKTKEYAAKGLPIISSSFVDSLSTEFNKKYVLNVAPDETAIDILDILNFYDSIYGSKTHYEVAYDIRENAKKICDMKVTLADIINFFEL